MRFTLTVMSAALMAAVVSAAPKASGSNWEDSVSASWAEVSAASAAPSAAPSASASAVWGAASEEDDIKSLLPVSELPVDLDALNFRSNRMEKRNKDDDDEDDDGEDDDDEDEDDEDDKDDEHDYKKKGHKETKTVYKKKHWFIYQTVTTTASATGSAPAATGASTSTVTVNGEVETVVVTNTVSATRLLSLPFLTI